MEARWDRRSMGCAVTPCGQGRTGRTLMFGPEYVIADGIPEKELEFLRRNIGNESGLALVEWDGQDKSALPGRFSPEKGILISADRELLAGMKRAGMATLQFIGASAQRTSVSDSAAAQEGGAPDMLVEGFEDADAEFFARVYQRAHHIPWTILETERCIVREITLDDLDDLFALYAGEGMTDYIEPLYAYEEEKEYQKAYIEHMYGFYGYGMWAVLEKATGKLIGRAGLEHRAELDGEVELGYAIGTPYQKKGFATEVCGAILRYAKERLGFGRIICLIQEGNEASEHVAKKLGFVFTDCLFLERKYMRRYCLEGNVSD